MHLPPDAARPSDPCTPTWLGARTREGRPCSRSFISVVWELRGRSVVRQAAFMCSALGTEGRCSVLRDMRAGCHTPKCSAGEGVIG